MTLQSMVMWLFIVALNIRTTGSPTLLGIKIPNLVPRGFPDTMYIPCYENLDFDSNNI